MGSDEGHIDPAKQKESFSGAKLQNQLAGVFYTGFHKSKSDPENAKYMDDRINAELVCDGRNGCNLKDAYVIRSLLYGTIRGDDERSGFSIADVLLRSAAGMEQVDRDAQESIHADAHIQFYDGSGQIQTATMTAVSLDLLLEKIIL